MDEAHGLTPIVGLGGGRIAAYDRDCLIIEIFRPTVAPAMGCSLGLRR